MDPKTILLASLVLILLAYHLYWFSMIRRHRAADGAAAPPAKPTPLALGIAFVANFFDTLGIGSYATTTTMARAWKVMPDERIPGTLNVGYVLPTVVQALIYITIVEVEFATLIIIIGAAVIGAWLGAGFVASLPRRGVQIGMGTALLGAAALMLVSLLGIGPAAGVALGLGGAKLALAFVISMILGALMMLGIGYYAPCLIMISLLGMNPTAAYPIMMGACAFLMPAGSLQFIRKDSYDLRTALAFTFGGPTAVLIAAFIVKSLPLDAVRWLVIAVVIYTATAMLRAARSEKAATRRAAGMARA
ncbi:MAG: permease [Acidobacteria bacterium]|nr:permease [Acidobacteriota bacterium]